MAIASVASITGEIRNRENNCLEYSKLACLVVAVQTAPPHTLLVLACVNEYSFNSTEDSQRCAILAYIHL